LQQSTQRPTRKASQDALTYLPSPAPVPGKGETDFPSPARAPKAEGQGHPEPGLPTVLGQGHQSEPWRFPSAPAIQPLTTTLLRVQRAFQPCFPNTNTELLF